MKKEFWKSILTSFLYVFPFPKFMIQTKHPIGAIICRKVGRKTGKDEYRNYIKVRENTKNGNNNFQSYSRWIIERKLGRLLEKEEIVHHKNGITTDDRIENLILMKLKEHIKHHKAGIKMSDETKRKLFDTCQKKRMDKVPLEVLKEKLKTQSMRSCVKYFGISWKTLLRVIHEDYKLEV